MAAIVLSSATQIRAMIGISGVSHLWTYFINYFVGVIQRRYWMTSVCVLFLKSSSMRFLSLATDLFDCSTYEEERKRFSQPKMLNFSREIKHWSLKKLGFEALCAYL